MQGQSYAARDAHVGCWVWEQDVDAMADGVRPFYRGRVFPPVAALRRNISINDYDAWGRRLLGSWYKTPGDPAVGAAHGHLRLLSVVE
jgi:hypothetical protein